MKNVKEILFPLLNPNERDALLIGVFVSEGQKVKKGEILFTLETTKSTAEVDAEADGYIVGLQVLEGDAVTAGDLFAYLADSPDWKPAKKVKRAKKEKTVEGEIPAGMRISQPALELARAHQFDLSQLPAGPIITEKMIRSLLQTEAAADTAEIVDVDHETEAIVVYGGGGHGKSVIDLLRELGNYRIVGVLDDSLVEGDEVLQQVPVLGGGQKLAVLAKDGIRQAVNAVGGIGNVNSRMAVFDKLAAAGFRCPVIIHPTAFIERSAYLSEAVQVFPHAYIGSDVQVGFGCIINTGAIISHDCILGEYANISPGAILAGGVHIGNMTQIGMGVTINLNVNIGQRVQVGNGATVKVDVPDSGIVRAGTIWPK